MHEQNTQSSFDFALPTMTPQSSRFGKENLFFAILPDAETLTACIEAQEQVRQSRLPFATPRPPQLLHVSLYSVDQRSRICDDVIFAACRAACAIDARQFELSFDHVATFRSSVRNAIVLAGNGGRELLRQLHVRIGIEMHNLGGDAHVNREFRPHVTLLYSDEAMPRMALEKPVTVAAREFVLIRRRAGETAYEHVARWPLQAHG